FDGARWTRAVLPSSGSDSVLAVREDMQGRLWAVGPQAVFRRTSANAPFEVVERLTVASNRWQSLAVDRRGNMWMSDFEHGFRQLDGPHPGATATEHAWGLDTLIDSQG